MLAECRFQGCQIPTAQAPEPAGNLCSNAGHEHWPDAIFNSSRQLSNIDHQETALYIAF